MNRRHSFNCGFISLLCFIVIVLRPLVLVSVLGCGLPVVLNTRRYDSGLTEANGKIYYSGGIRSNVLSSVEIFDPQTDSVVKTINLPAPRRNIFSATIGSLVVFVGGIRTENLQAVNYNAVDIYDTEADRMWTIDLPDLNVNSRRPVIAGTKMYFYPARQRVTELDLMTNRTSQVFLSESPDVATSNGTHVFFLTSGYILVLEATTNSRRTFSLNLPPLSGTVRMTAIGSDTVVVVRGRSLAQLDLLYDPVRYSLITLPEVVFSHNLVGDRWYLLGANTISVFSPTGRLLEYRLGTRFSEGVSVVYDNILYFVSSSTLADPGRFNLDALFKPAPIGPEIYTNMVADNGYIFIVDQQRLQYYNLQTQQSGELPHLQQINQNVILRSYSLNNKTLFVLYPLYGIFDSQMDTWTTYQMPMDIQRYMPSGSGLDRYVLFTYSPADTFVFVFDMELNHWHRIHVNRGRQHIAQDKLVVVGNNNTIQIYDIPTQIWTLLVDNSDYLLVDSFVHRDTIVLQVRNKRDFQTSVHLYNVITADYKYVQAPLTLSQNSLVAGDYAIFVRTTRADQWVTQVAFALNMKSLTWTQFNLPPTAEATILTRAHRGVVYIARGGRVDTIDTSTLRLGSVNVPVEVPEQIYAYGSKVVFVGASIESDSRSAIIFETSMNTWTSVVIGNRHQQGIQLTQNYLVSGVYNTPHWIEFPAMLNTIENEGRFIGQAIEFTVNVAGDAVRPQWLFGNGLSENGFTLSLQNLTERNTGTFSFHVSDRCLNRMTQSAVLTVHGVPQFAEQLTASIMLCDDTSRIYANATGKDMQIRWEIDNTLLEITDRDHIDVSKEKLALACNSKYQLCAIAGNPSGQVRSCTTVQIRTRNSLFDGPRVVSPQALYFTDSIVNLVVTVLHEDCTEHVWLLNGNEMDVQHNNSISVKMSTVVTANTYKVRAVCGSTELESYPFSFTASEVSSLTETYLALIVVGAFVLVSGAIVAAVLVRQRFIQSQKHEIELENLLTQAKSDTYKPKDGVSIISSTTWEWSPGDEYTYRSIDNFPCDIDTSLLKYSSKNSVDVDVWVQGDIVFTPKDKSESSDKKRERLLSGLAIDVYVPKSPKYEVKVEPAAFTLQANKQVRVTVSSLMRMTTKSNVCLIVVCEQQMIYSVIEFKIESKPSMWIDIEEVKMTGDFLGGGGFGAVTRGVYRGQDVAVKKLLLQYMVDDVLKEFEHEISLMKSLHHPNIVQFVGASNVHENLAIVIEFAPLGSLASAMKKQKLSLSMKITALFETAKALQFLHANGIIHRDIKPQNILVFSLEQKAPVHVKLTDFGTARFITENATNVTRNVGTFVYMAPESLGKNPRIDKGADVYSFAILMWEVLYEREPFADFQWQSDLELHVLAGKRLVLEPLPNDHLPKLIEDCWHPDPAQRPSMTSIAQHLADMQ